VSTYSGHDIDTLKKSINAEREALGYSRVSDMVLFKVNLPCVGQLRQLEADSEFTGQEADISNPY